MAVAALKSQDDADSGFCPVVRRASLLRMDEPQDIGVQAARLEKLLEERFSARRGTLAQRVARVGRELPRSVRRDLGRVAEAADVSGHPKLSMRIDRARVTAASLRAESYLRNVDAGFRRRGKWLGVAAGLVVNLALGLTLLIVVLRWRGFL